MDFLRNEGPKLDCKGDKKQQPVEEDDAVGIAEARMLEPLNGEDDEE